MQCEKCSNMRTVASETDYQTFWWCNTCKNIVAEPSLKDGIPLSKIRDIQLVSSDRIGETEKQNGGVNNEVEDNK